ILLGILSALNTSTPGAHLQPNWPFPIDFAWDAARVDRSVAMEVWSAFGVALVALLAAALAARLRRPGLVVLALAVFVGALAVPSWLLAAPAYPTTYMHSPIRYEAASIARGEPIYAANCVKCHGPYGYGDGPAAAQLGIRPANLTGAHLYHHGE